MGDPLLVPIDESTSDPIAAIDLERDVVEEQAPGERF
jgi:hypothetical protein